MLVSLDFGSSKKVPIFPLYRGHVRLSVIAKMAKTRQAKKRLRNHFKKKIDENHDFRP